MALPLPNVPYKSKVADAMGFVSPAWAGFYRDLYAKLGGAQAPDLSTLNQNVRTLQTEMTSAQSDIADLQNAIVASNGLGIGPVL